MKILTKVLSGVALFGALTMNAQALVVNYEGAVTAATGAMQGLIPTIPLAMDGFIEFDDHTFIQFATLKILASQAHESCAGNRHSL